MQGPLNITRSPQGRPVIIEAGSLTDGEKLAAETAEVVFTAVARLEEAQTFYQSQKAQVEAAGRNPDHVVIMPGVMPIVGRAREEAKTLWKELNTLVDIDNGIKQLSLRFGMDMSAFPLDGTVPEVPLGEGNQSRVKLMTEMAKRENLTIVMSFDVQRVGENRAGESASTVKQPLQRSLLAVLIAASVAHSAQAAETPASEQTLTVDGSASAGDAAQQAAQDYSVPITRAGTKMALTTRDIPQSVTVVSKQRMEDQQLQSLNDVLHNTMGITGVSSYMDRTTYYSRGFAIDNFMVDRIPTTFASHWNLGDAQSDTALYGVSKWCAAQPDC